MSIDWLVFAQNASWSLAIYSSSTDVLNLYKFVWYSIAFPELQCAVIAALIECLLCHLWATNSLPHQSDWWETPYINLFLGGSMLLWRGPHFYAIHRALHPWRISWFPDVGQFLYKRVHYLHHKSSNPTSWSGTSMHPVEAILYYSACIIPAIFGLHPIHTVATIIDCGISAWCSHDGFVSPGTGSSFHLLHHTQFDCNYGSLQVPFDKWFGTFAATKDDVGKIWRK